MIRTLRVVYCDNEHGTGDVTFPDVIDPEDFEKYPTRKTVWKLARAAGWRRIMGADYCPGCVASITGKDGAK